MQNTKREFITGTKSFFADWLSPSACASTLILLTSVFRLDGLDLFLLPPTQFLSCLYALYLLFAIIFVGALIKACVQKKEKSTLRIFRFVILNFVTLSIVTFVPLSEIRNDLDFNFNFGKRMEVVERAINGELHRAHDKNGDIYSLPAGWKYLSKGGGEVIVNSADKRIDAVDPRTLHVLFFTDRGILSQYAGFEYAADGNPNTTEMARSIKLLNMSQNNPVEPTLPDNTKLLRKNWYWVNYSGTFQSF
ncbi:MAG: hypothetical protein P4L53_06795 [Candidatus Obscuribacterales bacterium]|nr:hypothetical protein [Candidatus Obscuribacterales bacterium]